MVVTRLSSTGSAAAPDADAEVVPDGDGDDASDVDAKVAPDGDVASDGCVEDEPGADAGPRPAVAEDAPAAVAG
jgi:hypothetical protein